MRVREQQRTVGTARLVMVRIRVRVRVRVMVRVRVRVGVRFRVGTARHAAFTRGARQRVDQRGGRPGLAGIIAQGEGVVTVDVASWGHRVIGR